MHQVIILGFDIAKGLWLDACNREIKVELLVIVHVYTRVCIPLRRFGMNCNKLIYMLISTPFLRI